MSIAKIHNPANDYINIHLANTYNQITYKLYDVQGRILLSVELTNQHQQIDISNLYAGIYFIRFTDTNRIEKLFYVVLIAFAWAYVVGVFANENLKHIKTLKHGQKSKSFFKYGLNIIANTLLNKLRNNDFDIFKFLSCT